MLSSNNLVTSFNFIEESGEIGDTNIFKTSIAYNFDEKIHLFLILEEIERLI